MNSTLIIPCLVALFLPSVAQAGFLGSHSRVIAQTLNGFPGFVQIEGDGPLDTGLLDHKYPNFEPYRVSATARAFSNLDALHFLGAGASAYSDVESTFHPDGRSVAGAYWRDIATIGGGFNPSFITLNFDVEGSLRGQNNGFSSALSVNMSNNVDGGFDNYFDQVSAQLTHDGFTAGGFDSLSTTDIEGGIHFTGSFHIDAPYNATLGGYDWGVVLTVRADAIRGFLDIVAEKPTWAEVGSLQSIALRSVIDPDGNPIAVTFDSGLSLQSASTVPEPTSIILFGLGAIGLGFVAARRRVKHRVAA